MKQIYLVCAFLCTTFISFAQVPPNDEIQNAVNITSLPFTDYNVQTQNATTASGGGMNGCNFGTTYSRVYYKYQSPINQTIRVKLTEESNNSIIMVYDSNFNTNVTSDSQLYQVSSCEFNSDLTISIQSVQTYYIVISNPDNETNVLISSIDDTNIVNIPDPNFKNALLNQSNPVINTNGDTDIQVSEAFFADRIKANNKNISDLTGVEAFTNLEALFASYNENLDNIDLSQNLKLENLWLDNCGFINDLDLTNNVALKTININNNNISNVNLTQNINLENLRLDQNLLTSIDLSNNTLLTDISLNENLLTNIDLSQNTLLETFYCRYNQLTQLGLTNNINIKNVVCDNNELSSIDVSQCQNLEWLFLNGNNLSTINLNYNPHLVDLSIRNNPLVSIDLSQNLELFYLDVSGSLMQNIDLSINSNLVHFDARNNEFLETVNFKNNYNTVFDTTDFVIYTSNSGYDYYYSPYFNASNNPNLQTICVDDVAYATTKFTNIDPNTVFVEDCSINNYNSIQGTLAFDDENNGCDTNDFVVANQLIQATDGVNNMATFTNSTGDYTLYLNENTYSAEVLGLPSNFSATPNPYNTTFTGFGTSENADFCITSSQTMNDVNVVLLPITQARPGFDSSYQLVFENTGTTLLSGDVTLQFDDASQTFVSSNPTTSASTSNSLTFNYTNLQPFEIRTIDIVMNTFPPTTVNDGDILNFTATINPISGDNNVDDNTFVLEQTVVNSYDPNDKQVLQGTEITLAQAGEYLDYMIRFQNTGSASAINVVITDVLSNKLDWTSIRPISSSHEFTTRIINGDFVEFTFENINLPAQVNDDAGSNGFVAFKIKPKADVVVGDFILGKANIYFDYNAPIITNTVSTEIVTQLSVEENKIEASIKIYPNPVNDYLNVKSKKPIKQIAIYDLQGRQIKTMALTGNLTTTKADLSSLSKGVYFVSIKTETGIQISKIIKE